MKTFLLIVAIVILVLAVAAFTAGFFMARFACLKNKKHRDFWVDSDDIPFYDKLAPEDIPMIQAGREYLLTHVEPPVSIQSRDGLRLVGRYLPPAENPDTPKGIYLQVHGYRSHPLCDFPGAAVYMAGEGYGVFLIDHRAMGGSEGKYITFGLRERYDVADWCAYLKERFPTTPVLLDGVSMGGATVLLAAGEDLPDNVVGVIADCGYTSPAAICKKCLKQWFHLPPFPIYYAALLWIRLFCGVWFTAPFWRWGGRKGEKVRYETGDCTLALERTKLPILIAHGMADDFVPYEMSVENFAHANKERVTLLSVPDAAHGMAWMQDRESYRAAIRDLWVRALERAKWPQE